MIKIKVLLEEVLKNSNVPKPGNTSGSPQSYHGNCQKRRMSASDILKKCRGVVYYKEVWDDYRKKDFTWDVTKKVVEYAEYLKTHPQSVKNLPPIEVLDGTLKDGSHRLSALFLLSKTENSNWLNTVLNVDWWTSNN
jgi:5-methylcytosine-specific restriction endonuclease McrA